MLGSAIALCGQATDVTSPVLSARELWAIEAPCAGLFGESVASLGDLDGDGVADLAVGSPLRFDAWKSAKDVGCIVFVSGKDGRVICQLDQTRPSDFDLNSFGENVATLGDIDGDGRRDLCALELDASALFERAFVISGAPKCAIASLGADFGYLLASSRLADIDGDGRAEWLAVTGSQHSLEIRACSGATGSTRYTISAMKRFCGGLTALGDVDGDGVADFAASGFCEGPPNQVVHVFSGRDGRLVRSLGGEVIEQPGSVLTVRLEPLGAEDLLVDERNGTRSTLRVVSLDGRHVRALTRCPDSVASVCPPLRCVIDDCDGDGVNDLVAWAADPDARDLLALSGRDGTPIARLVLPQPRERWKIAVEHGLANVGDLNGDGRNEIAVQTCTSPTNLGDQRLIYSLCVLEIVPRTR